MAYNVSSTTNNYMETPVIDKNYQHTLRECNVLSVRKLEKVGLVRS